MSGALALSSHHSARLLPFAVPDGCRIVFVTLFRPVSSETGMRPSALWRPQCCPRRIKTFRGLSTAIFFRTIFVRRRL